MHEFIDSLYSAEKWVRNWRKGWDNAATFIAGYAIWFVIAVLTTTCITTIWLLWIIGFYFIFTWGGFVFAKVVAGFRWCSIVFAWMFMGLRKVLTLFDRAHRIDYYIRKDGKECCSYFGHF